MPKVSWSTPIENSSDATFRAWGSDIAARLATAGLIQTADTGQINWVTVLRPAASAYGGYEVWRFDDTLQGTSPVFMKIEYGSSNNQATPALRITVSSGTNGAGTPTGLVTTAIANYANGVLVANANITNFPSHAVHTDGFFALVFKMGAGVNALTLFSVSVQRSADNTGAPTGEAVALIGCGTGNQATVAPPAAIIKYVTSTVNNVVTGADIGFMPSQMTTSVVGVDPQIFLHWIALPKMSPLVGTATYILSEVGLNTEFDLALVGTTPRHYLAVGNSFRKTAYNGSVTVLGTAILWEN